MSRTLSCSSSNYYVTTTQNNRIKIWEIDNSNDCKNEIGNLLNEIGERDHLKIHYTAVTIFDSKQDLPINNNNNEKIENFGLIALGDVTGRIAIFDIDTNKKLLQISQTAHSQISGNNNSILTSSESIGNSVNELNTIYIQAGHQSRINSLQFNVNSSKVNNMIANKNKNNNNNNNKNKNNKNKNKGKNKNENENEIENTTNFYQCIELYSCSNDKKLFQWTMKGELLRCINIGDTIPSCIATTNFKITHKAKGIRLSHINSNENPFVIVGCSHINVYDINKENSSNINTPIATYTGHASQMRHLKLTEDNFYCISCAQGREIYVWKLRNHWKKNKQRSVPLSGKQEKKQDKTDNKNELKLESAIQKMVLNDQIVDIATFQFGVKIEKDENSASKSAKKKSRKKNKNNNNKQNSGDNENDNTNTQEAANTITKHKYYIAAASKSEIHIWLFDPTPSKSGQSEKNDSVVDSKTEEKEDIDLDMGTTTTTTKKKGKNKNKKSKTKTKGNSNNKSNNNNDNQFDSLTPICTIKLENYGTLSDRNSKSKSSKITYSWIRSIEFINKNEILITRGNASMVIFKKLTFCSENEFIKNIDLEIVDASTFSGKNNEFIKSGFTKVYEKEKETVVDPQLNVMDVADAARPQPKSIEMWDASGLVDANENDNNDNDNDDSVTTKGKKRGSLNDENENENENEIDENEEDTMMPPKKKQKMNKKKNQENDNENSNENENDNELTINDIEMLNLTTDETKISKENSNDNDDNDDTNMQSTGMTFAEKLAAMESKDEENRKLGLQSGVPTADSLAQLLQQSLLSKDDKMFENVLKMQNEGREFEDELIRNTLDRISSEIALLLLNRLCQKFRVSPRKTIPLLRWLVPLLNRHAGTFSKNLQCRKNLESINQAIDYHIKSILPAMKLQGRLSLLVNQIDKVRQLKEKEKNTNDTIEDGLKRARYQPLFTHFDGKE